MLRQHEPSTVTPSLSSVIERIRHTLDRCQIVRDSVDSVNQDEDSEEEKLRFQQYAREIRRKYETFKQVIYGKILQELAERTTSNRPEMSLNTAMAVDTVVLYLYKLQEHLFERFMEKVKLKMRRRQIRFTDDVQNIMLESFLRDPYPDEEEKTRLAQSCRLTSQQVTNWFTNRRARMKPNTTHYQPLMN
jgi:hypothetical protein